MNQQLIACELLLLSKPRITGIERYAFETIRSAAGPYRLVWGRPTDYTDQLRQESFTRGWPVHEIDAPHHIAEQFLFGAQGRAFNPRGIHYFSVAPGLLRPRVPFTITLYDMSAWRFPQFMSRGMRYLYRPLIDLVVRSPLLRGVLTISQFSKEEIHQVLGIDSEKIFVVYPPEPIVSLDRPQQFEAGVSERYFLHVGTIEPRKNVELVIDAFRDSGLEDVKLYLVGRLGWSRLPELPKDVHYLGPVDDRSLGHLYRNAIAVVSASYYEGFGLPPAEALVAGSVVFLNDIPVYRELYGENANAWFFRSKQDLVDLFRLSPGRKPSPFFMPRSTSFDYWMQKYL